MTKSSVAGWSGDTSQPISARLCLARGSVRVDSGTDSMRREGDEKQKRGEEDWDWGDERDRVLREDYVRRLVGEHGEHLPETAAALRRLDAMGQAGP